MMKVIKKKKRMNKGKKVDKKRKIRLVVILTIKHKSYTLFRVKFKTENN